MELSIQIARDLLKIQAVFFSAGPALYLGLGHPEPGIL